MNAWAATAVVLIAGIALLSAVDQRVARGWAAVTRAFIVAPLAFVAMALISSLT